MSKKAIAFVIIALVFVFPFRWVYMEYPQPLMVNKTMVDSGRIEYVLYFLSCVAGFLAFFFLATPSDSEAH